MKALVKVSKLLLFSVLHFSVFAFLGVQFDNIWKPNTPDDDLSLGIVMIMLLVDAVLYLLIALYVEAVFPGAYGVPKKWYFLFTTAFWWEQSRSSGK